ncbi:MAG: host-nuclease inhibitor Gam family protein [Peptoniphilaceae bacterium]
MEAIKVVDFIDEEVEEKERFEVTDLQSAEWCFRKIAQIKEGLEEQEIYTNNQIEEYKNYLRKYRDDAENSIAFFENLIKEYVDKKLEEDPKFKLKTLKGTASYGKEKDSWDYGNEEKLLNFLKDNDLKDFIRVKESIDKTKLKTSVKVTEKGEVVTEDGEILEEVNVTKKRDFNIRIK